MIQHALENLTIILVASSVSFSGLMIGLYCVSAEFRRDVSDLIRRISK